MSQTIGDEMLLLSDRHCFTILDWVAEHPKDGLVLRAFLASMALAALRPAEALALRVQDAQLPPDDSSGILVVRAQEHHEPEEGSRSVGAGRCVPACPELVAILKAEIVRRNLSHGDVIFVLDDGRPLTGSVYRRVWKQARAAALEPHEFDSPLGKNVSDLRDACIAAWLRNGDQTAAHIALVAECAGISAPHLAERFACCLRKPKPDEIPWDRLEAAFRLPDSLSEPTTAAQRS